MAFKGILAATTAVAMIAAPTMAAAQSAEVAPASESVNGGSELRGGFIIPLIALIAILLGIYAATHNNNDDLPRSP